MDSFQIGMVGMLLLGGALNLLYSDAVVALNRRFLSLFFGLDQKMPQVLLSVAYCRFWRAVALLLGLVLTAVFLAT